MAQMTLSASTQQAIAKALSSPGTNNQNYVAAYNAIASDIESNGGFNQGTVNWFSQAGAVDQQYYNPTAQGTYIWNYTIYAALNFGVNVTNQTLSVATQAIAKQVFLDLQRNNYVFSDSLSSQINFAPSSIVSTDAGIGIATINKITGANLDMSVWGGTLFAATELNDPTYASDYKLNITPGSADCNAILAGFAGGSAAESIYLLQNPAQLLDAGQGAFQLDGKMLGTCSAGLTGLILNNPTFSLIENSDGSFTINEGTSNGDLVTDTSSNGASTSVFASSTSGTPMFNVSYNYNSDGLQSESLVVDNASGSPSYSASGSYSGNDGTDLNATLSGTGSVFNLSSGSSSNSSGTDTITDSSSGGNTIDTGSTGNYDFSGTNDVVNNFLTSTSYITTIFGGGNTVNVSGNSTTDIDGPNTVNINPANSDNLDLFSGPVTFNTGTGTPFSPTELAVLNGLGNSLSSAAMNSNTDATYSGSDQSVTISGTNITATGISSGNVQAISSTQSSVTGTKSAFLIGAGSTITVNGTGNRTDIVGNNVTLTQESGGTVFVGAYNTGSVITGNNLTIDLSRTGSIAAVYGNNNTIVTIGGPNSLVAETSTSGKSAAAAAFAAGGTGNTITYDASGYGSYGGYGLSEAPPTSGTNIGVIASYDAQLGDQSGANTALSARLQAESSLASSRAAETNTPEFEGAKWVSKTITWSLATTYDLVGAQLSGLISSQYLPLIQQAFNDWSVISGLNFKQVAASASPDIELGWTTFNTAVTGVLGYTGFSAINGAIQSGALISLENPADDALAEDANGQLAYTGTQTELEQLILHEIGHALGLADDSDPDSVMYAVLGASNRTLDATDIAGIQALYQQVTFASKAASAAADVTTGLSDITSLASHSPITVASSLISNLTSSALTPFAAEADQLIDAMASFSPTASPTTFISTTLASVASGMTLASAVG